MLNQADIEKKYNEAPKEVKDLLGSQDIVEEISAIGKKYLLQIDRVGKLEEVITLFILSLISEKDFLDSVLGIVGGDKQRANTLVSEINTLIFIPIRKKILSDSPALEDNRIGNREESPVVSVKRDDLLDAIENPAPISHPISIAQPKPAEKTRPSSEAVDVAHAFIGEKLSAPVSLPSQKTVIKTETKKPSPSVDPYREPIN